VFNTPPDLRLCKEVPAVIHPSLTKEGKGVKFVENLVRTLRSHGKRIYLSHEPWQEVEARNFARGLEAHGFEVIVAADVRPDMKSVERAIAGCNAVVIYMENYHTGANS